MTEDIKKHSGPLPINYMNAAEYKHIVLGLVFFKYISDTFQTHRDELATRFFNPDDDYFVSGADSAMLAEELETRDYYREANVIWVPEAAPDG